MQDAHSAMVELSEDECRQLLATHRPRLGRLAFVDAGWPLVLPMNYVADRGVIYFRTAPGSKLMAALKMQQVAFEVDHVDEVWKEGWSLRVGRSAGRGWLNGDRTQVADAYVHSSPVVW
jgi:nitroimidazol reductase NimA-like FMN-containing flavoprotein (pyridoxamine 5'-phosphate oxidase superfamily)